MLIGSHIHAILRRFGTTDDLYSDPKWPHRSGLAELLMYFILQSLLIEYFHSIKVSLLS